MKKLINSSLKLIKTVNEESENLNIRTPIILYVEVVNRLLHVYGMYRSNETLVYMFYKDDLYFIKEQVVYDDKIHYTTIREKLNINLTSFDDIIQRLCITKRSGIEDILHDIK